MLVARIFLLSAFLGTAAIAAATSKPECKARTPDGPVYVTPDCVDPSYSTPVIDSETDVTSPVPHRQVSGHFDGSDIKFNVYMPPKAQWAGRFFQLVYPLQNETASARTIAFGADSGAYTVQATGMLGYRAEAATAKFARTIAAEYYGESASRHIYGYIYGGSGGSFQTVGAMENTQGVWDGGVPIVQAVPVSYILNHSVRRLAALALKSKADQVADAVRPGGSGDPYADLDEVQEAALREATTMGLPLSVWEDFATASNGSDLLALGETARGMDPTYADDFWALEGYLGTEESGLGDLIRSSKIDHNATIDHITLDAEGLPILLELSSIPASITDTTGLDLTVYDDTTEIGTLTGTLDPIAQTFTPSPTNNATILTSLKESQTLQINNKWYLALHAFHRHQVPTRPGFTGFDQFLDANNNPLFPQRNIEVAKNVAISTTGGSTHTGNITGKVIVIDNLLDADAFPLHADWYASQVRQAGFAESYRLWYNEHADHTMGELEESKSPRLVDFTGSYEQALRDLSAWVEDGISPPDSTGYTLSSENQVQFSAERYGIQPSVEMTVDGATQTTVQPGESITVKAQIQVPPGAGQVVVVEWDAEGTGDFVTRDFGDVDRTVELEFSVAYEEPGVYFPVLRAASQRNGDEETAFARVFNLGRARVAVS